MNAVIQPTSSELLRHRAPYISSPRAKFQTKELNSTFESGWNFPLPEVEYWWCSDPVLLLLQLFLRLWSTLRAHHYSYPNLREVLCAYAQRFSATLYCAAASHLLLLAISGQQYACLFCRLTATWPHWGLPRVLVERWPCICEAERSLPSVTNHKCSLCCGFSVS